MSSRPRSFPYATYRLQFNRDFTFAAAAQLVPYLHRLGVSHCYASPLLKARLGSMHGYDIVDHHQLNPELGGRADFDRLVAGLHEHGMGLIVDIVPNHMGVGGADNAWWQDVLENGPAAEYADFFDIDWRPAHETLRGKILLPLLGQPYGAALDKGEIKLDYDSTAGSFHFAYYEHRLPLDPVTYPAVAAPGLEALRRRLPADDPGRAELENLLTALAHLPGRADREPERRQERRRDKEITKQRLRELGARFSWVNTFWQQCLDYFNQPGDHRPEAVARRGERLHQLLEQQVYRPAHWVVAGDEINYRRFFDINSLAGLQAEREEVFTATHGLLLELVAAGRIDGLRVDHPDGLSDPAGYFRRLQAAVAAVRADSGTGPVSWSEGNAAPELVPGSSSVAGPGSTPAEKSGGETAGIYLVVEKILAVHEHLPKNWQVHGTTGYDFVNQVNGLFVQPAHEAVLSRIYHRFVGRRQDFDELLYRRKKLIITGQLASELTVLARLLKDIAEGDRHTRDFTLNGLREALIEITAAFPVYRTYIIPAEAGAAIYQVAPEDRRHVEWAVAQARKRAWARDGGLYDFIRSLLTGESHGSGVGDRAGAAGSVLAEQALTVAGESAGQMSEFSLSARFIRKFQQYTAPVMAKALEDTTFYVANRLLSLNEVGGDPRRFYVSPAAFHHAAQERLRRWPVAMLATSTHDSKRSEDVRSRINVLSEVPELWGRYLKRWRRLNRSRKSRVNGRLAPSPNDEYFLYQTLLGSWPLNAQNGYNPGGDSLGDYRGRIREYMLKVIREAKTHTSWLNPDAAYEEAVARFVEQLLSPPGVAGPGGLTGANPFLADFVPLVRQLAPYGLLNALAQVLLKLTSPGVPDLYQGTELWDFSLVDPDNRRPVDYRRRRELLAALPDPTRPATAEMIKELLANLEDGRLKLLLTSRLLHLRRQIPELFGEGGYQPLTATGERGEHLCAFVRQWREHRLLVITGRWFATLAAVGTPPESGGGNAGRSRLEAAADSAVKSAGGTGGVAPAMALLNPQLWQNTVLPLPEDSTPLDRAADQATGWQDLLTGRKVPVLSGPDGNYLTCGDLFATLPMAVLYSRAAV
ncbi:malto-oligosyltrehalose synthase [Desulfurivibrio dismutans]|uniref:malto-oligosyltrehalose synthase n=1 Tax=Desulfurivibrio dismutans TaxID=1398908 RepID=UPI0023DB68AD|nr:malto-oligosyltrehalose synthase [Desulfurivibrio alkaliphilus]MDF1615773.1 malto-oligosyltrehalose synthase [Desulfurivibrio alkaliphilus]